MTPAGSGYRPTAGDKVILGWDTLSQLKTCSAGDNTDQWGKSPSALITPGNLSNDDDVFNLV